MLCLFVFFKHPIQPLGHEDHEQCEQCHVEGIEPDADIVADQTEDGGHEGTSRIGACHLNAHDGLGIFPTEVGGGGVDNAGVNGRATQACDDKSRKGKQVGGGGDHNEHKSAHKNGGANPHKRFVTEAVGEEAVEKPSHRDAKEEEGGEGGGGFGIGAAMLHEITGGPKTRRGLKGAVGEKGQEHVGNAADLKRADHAKRRGDLRAIGCRLRDGFLPKRNAYEHKDGEDQLDHEDDMVSRAPTEVGGEAVGHDVRADRCAKTPEAVKPAHVPRREVEGHVVVQCRVNGACAEAVGN